MSVSKTLSLKKLLFHSLTSIAALNLYPLSLEAKDLGVYGALFPIDEENLLKVIQKRLQSYEKSGKLESLQKDIQEKVKQKVLNPTPVDAIKITQIPRVFTFDPTLTIEENILDHQGNILVKAGTRVNPLEYKPWGKPLLFLKGDLKEQQELISNYPDVHIVLVSGQPLELEKQYKRPIFFDQGGVLTKKFNLQHVPCLIIQQENRLLIKEFSTTGKNHDF